MTRGSLLLRRIRLCWEKEYRYYGADDNGGGSPKVRSPLVEDNPYHRQLLEGHDHAVRAQAGNTHPEHDNRVLPPRLASYPPHLATRTRLQHQLRPAEFLDTRGHTSPILRWSGWSPPRGLRSVQGGSPARDIEDWASRIISFIILLA